MKIITFLAVILFSGFLYSPAFANSNNIYRINYTNVNKAFSFSERGITFTVFQNGEFDFYTNRVKQNYFHSGIGHLSISYNLGYNYNSIVQYDDYGAIIQIESVPVYYDYYGRVARIGNVSLNYSRNYISRIGGLHIYYNSHGHYSHYTGFVNNYNRRFTYYANPVSFARPIWNNCIVSYKPYRIQYKPYRYNFYNGKIHYKNQHNKNNYFNKNRRFKQVDSRIVISDSQRKRGKITSKTYAVHRDAKTNYYSSRTATNKVKRKLNNYKKINSNKRAITKTQSSDRENGKIYNRNSYRKVHHRDHKEKVNLKPRKDRNPSEKKVHKSNISNSNSRYIRNSSKSSAYQRNSKKSRLPNKLNGRENRKNS